MIHQEFQSYSEISQWTQRKEWMKMERRTPKSIWRDKKQDLKSTSTCSSKERWKIQSGNRYFRTCDQKSLIPRTIQLAERNYKIYDKELHAIVKTLTKWEQYLLDTTEKFKVWTDHKNLKYFWKLHKLNGWQARWYLKLQDYDFILQHIPGKINMKADDLSRKN